jgi:ubiquinone/menaquinone biosynthesis C-methylase UbiE
MSKEFFNARAVTWDENAAEKDVAKLQSMAAKLDIPPGAIVLDVGTGTGVFVPYILRKIGRSGKLVCLDYAKEMLKVARAKNFTGNIHFVCADIVKTGLPGSMFDAVVCYSVFPHFTHHLHALREICRVLKPGGWLYICHTSSRYAINKIHRSIPEICDHVFPENEDLCRMLIIAGLVNISIGDGKEDYLVTAEKPQEK